MALAPLRSLGRCSPFFRGLISILDVKLQTSCRRSYKPAAVCTNGIHFVHKLVSSQSSVLNERHATEGWRYISTHGGVCGHMGAMDCLHTWGWNRLT